MLCGLGGVQWAVSDRTKVVEAMAEWNVPVPDDRITGSGTTLPSMAAGRCQSTSRKRFVVNCLTIRSGTFGSATWMPTRK